MVSMITGRGHSASTAATIAATSSSVGVGLISSFMQERRESVVTRGESASDRQEAADTERGAKATEGSGGERAHS
jgi:hypothetical protein